MTAKYFPHYWPGVFPSQGPWLWYFRCYQPEQAVEQTAEFPREDPMTHMTSLFMMISLFFRYGHSSPAVSSGEYPTPATTARHPTLSTPVLLGLPIPAQLRILGPEAGPQQLWPGQHQARQLSVPPTLVGRVTVTTATPTGALTTR